MESTLGDPNIRKRFGVKVGDAATVSASGDTTLYTPPAGKHLRLTHISLSSATSNTAETLVNIYLGSQNPVRWNMGAPGGYARSMLREGAVNETLKVNLSAAQPVHISFDLEVF